jgi:hypothetical protein
MTPPGLGYKSIGPGLDYKSIASQWGLQLIFRMHNSDPTPPGVENRNILLWFKCVLTALHVSCMILFDKVH